MSPALITAIVGAIPQIVNLIAAANSESPTPVPEAEQKDLALQSIATALKNTFPEGSAHDQIMEGVAQIIEGIMKIQASK